MMHTSITTTGWPYISPGWSEVSAANDAQPWDTDSPENENPNGVALKNNRRAEHDWLEAPARLFLDTCWLNMLV